MAARRRRKKAGLKFRLSADERPLSGMSILWLLSLPIIFCGALLLAFDREAPRALPASSWQASVPAVGGGPHAGVERPRSGTATGKESVEARSVRTAAYTFGTCGRRPHTCVVDGDTLWIEGEKIRIADIDTPEIGRPRCLAELQHGLRARDRLIDLLNRGRFELLSTPAGDSDRYGRKLRVITRSGESIGDQLVREQLARPWRGRRLPWCQS